MNSIKRIVEIASEVEKIASVIRTLDTIIEDDLDVRSVRVMYIERLLNLNEELKTL